MKAKKAHKYPSKSLSRIAFLRFSELFKIKYLVVTYMLFYVFIGMITFSALDRPPIFLGLFIVPLHFILKINSIERFPSYLKWYGLFVLFEIIDKFALHENVISGNSLVGRTLSYLLSFLIIFLVENIKFSDEFICDMKRWLSIFLFLAMVVSLIQLSIPNFLGNAYFKDVGDDQRVGSFFSWEGDNKGGLFTVPILLALLITDKRIYLKSANLIRLILPVLVIVILTGSRAGLMNVAIVMFWLASHRRSSGVIKIIFLTLFLLYITLNFVSYNFNYLLNERLTSDTSARLIIYKYVFLALGEFPVIGDGLGGMEGNFYVDTDLKFGNRVHNGFLAILLNYGILGLLLYLRFTLSWFRAMKKCAKQTGYYGGLLTFYIFLVTNLTVDITHFMWPGLILTFVFTKYFQDLRKRLDENPDLIDCSRGL